MGKLTDLGPGEITDRLTILSLKILFGNLAGKDCTHWLTERSKLLPQIRSRSLNGAWFEQVLELAAVNAALWHAEEDLRQFRSVGVKSDPAFTEPVVQLAFTIQDLNDRRAALIALINTNAGEKSAPEKL